MNSQTYIEILRHIVSSEASWVLFENGTVVFLSNAPDDLSGAAIEVLREFGPVEIGGPAGDFATMNLGDDIGWGVTYDHPDLLTLVLPSEINVKPTDLMIGLMGRGKRGDDAVELKVVHVEDRRKEMPS